MLGGVGGRHVSTRRRGSIPPVRGSVGLIGYGATSGSGGPLGNTTDGNAQLDAIPRYAARRRKAVTTLDHKRCALIHTRLKFGDIIDGRVVVEERGSVVERPSRCGHELRRSGNVGSV
ncbi:hypothetical protein ALC62_02352 [Cyphomyrmex costatus]|uniref:Uncharacterized protein n=1 Tax=Cyphomyrmex costatus TaxID=456900 RepID=A0A195D2V6_9HYME|nr:hypothetical protein ALC62_02352 [Cyphomyrmex costatus]